MTYGVFTGGCDALANIISILTFGLHESCAETATAGGATAGGALAPYLQNVLLETLEPSMDRSFNNVVDSDESNTVYGRVQTCLAAPDRGDIKAKHPPTTPTQPMIPQSHGPPFGPIPEPFPKT